MRKISTIRFVEEPRYVERHISFLVVNTRHLGLHVEVQESLAFITVYAKRGLQWGYTFVDVLDYKKILTNTISRFVNWLLQL